MEEEDPYESLHQSHPLWVHMSAGALAGVMEHCLMYPIDSVKTRMQSLCDCPQRKYKSPIGGLLNMSKTEGWLRSVRGMSVVAGGSMPAHALYFSVYEKLKEQLTGGKRGHDKSWAYFVAGCGATVVHDAVMNPVEVVKQRMQMFASPYSGTLQCATCIWRKEGPGAFYRSYATQLLLNIPFQTTHFMVYEACQRSMNPAGEYQPSTHVFAGGLGGGLAAAVTTPLDAIKTVLNTQQSTNVEYKTANGSHATGTFKGRIMPTFRGSREAVMSIYNVRGVAGFYSGIQARVMFQVPATGLSWFVYETFKYLLSRNSSDAHNNKREIDRILKTSKNVDKQQQQQLSIVNHLEGALPGVAEGKESSLPETDCCAKDHLSVQTHDNNLFLNTDAYSSSSRS